MYRCIVYNVAVRLGPALNMYVVCCMGLPSIAVGGCCVVVQWPFCFVLFFDSFWFVWFVFGFFWWFFWFIGI